MLSTRKIANQEPMEYATEADFCRIFKNDMNRLYQLAFLVTGDHALAEKCFVSGLEESTKGNPVFKEWAESWASRMILRNAIQMIRPRPLGGEILSPVSDGTVRHAAAEPAAISVLIGLPAFDRFVFVMAVLERYPDQECSLLLGCTGDEVKAARIRALERIGRSAGLRGQPAKLSQQPPRDARRATRHPELASRLAVSA
jgi:DNA-directed RNA polymerase specialized sigma24 family protein